MFYPLVVYAALVLPANASPPRHHQSIIPRLLQMNRHRQEAATSGRATKWSLGLRWHRARSAVLVVATAVLLGELVVAFFLGRDSAQVVVGHPSVRHVHALGVSSRNGALFVAGHTGVYRIDSGALAPTRVSNRSQDTTGLAIVHGNRFLGSGHSGSGEGDKPKSRLGLIQSNDGGKRWTPVSLAGRADFHVLRARSSEIVGYDASSGNVLTSRDGGTSWRRHRFEGRLVDLVIAPGRSRMLLATAPAQLLISRDGGRSWGSVAETTGLLAWPSRRRLYLLASDGRLWVSPDVGRRWRGRGQVGGHPVAFAAYGDGRLMYAALRNGLIKESTDGGRSWRRLASVHSA